MRFECVDCKNKTEFVKLSTTKRKGELKLHITEWIADLKEGSQINHGRWSEKTTIIPATRKISRTIVCKKCNSQRVTIFAMPTRNPYKNES